MSAWRLPLIGVLLALVSMPSAACLQSGGRIEHKLGWSAAIEARVSRAPRGHARRGESKSHPSLAGGHNARRKPTGQTERGVRGRRARAPRSGETESESIAALRTATARSAARGFFLTRNARSRFRSAAAGRVTRIFTACGVWAAAARSAYPKTRSMPSLRPKARLLAYAQIRPAGARPQLTPPATKDLPRCRTWPASRAVGFRVQRQDRR